MVLMLHNNLRFDSMPPSSNNNINSRKNFNCCKKRKQEFLKMRIQIYNKRGIGYRSIVKFVENKKRFYSRDRWSITLRIYYESCIVKVASVRVINSNRNQSHCCAQRVFIATAEHLQWRNVE